MVSRHSAVLATRAWEYQVMPSVISRTSHEGRPFLKISLALALLLTVIVLLFSVYDSNLDVYRARIQFLDGAGRTVGEAFNIDLAQTLRSRNLVRGQSFTVTQRFTGARDSPKVAGARVTVFDAEASDEASSVP